MIAIASPILSRGFSSFSVGLSLVDGIDIPLGRLHFPHGSKTVGPPPGVVPEHLIRIATIFNTM